MKKYILTFSAAYALAMIIIAILETFFKAPSGSSIICLISGGSCAAAFFVKDYQRIPEPSEKKALVWGCFFASIIISIIATIISIMIFPETAPFLAAIAELPIWIWLFAISFTALLHYLVLSLSFGWMAKRFAKAKTT
ncbi:ABZJ_00895 family protein [Acinetobacter courvalinii]|uniref:ABZJ_00895 family protein n=1 Tax=Acinetobacter courvalinii TaxID=280147 RepID=UPI0019020AC4|nr:ABZJ_00895 family protein [Acinetobacter courvalinii]MBJ8419031.1 ABZJ_00895 family protein [Acinetobacter courvalinii]MBJ9957240.1 ABZJ_00895 family protein [Acinetobacter courvalinii]